MDTGVRHVSKQVNYPAHQAQHKATRSGEEVDEETLVSEEELNDMKKADRFALVVYAVLVLMGIGTGYLLSRTSSGSVSDTKGPAEKVEMVKTEKAAGLTDTRTFKDSAEGTIEKGGLNGEGTHKLLREGGPSQTVYLVSSVLNLDEYERKKVRAWGQTYAGKKAAWFMDVGRIELIE